jgi:ribosomal protein S18 acetylase RimI-like enzyme
MAATLNNNFFVQKQNWDDFTIYLIANQYACIHLIIMADDKVADNGGEKATIYDLWVNKDCRQQGIGNHLMSLIEDIAKHESVDYVHLGCLVKSEDDKFILDWYKRMNYIEIGCNQSNPNMHVFRKKLN